MIDHLLSGLVAITRHLVQLAHALFEQADCPRDVSDRATARLTERSPVAQSQTTHIKDVVGLDVHEFRR